MHLQYVQAASVDINLNSIMLLSNLIDKNSVFCVLTVTLQSN